MWGVNCRAEAVNPRKTYTKMKLVLSADADQEITAELLNDIADIVELEFEELGYSGIEVYYKFMPEIISEDKEINGVQYYIDVCVFHNELSNMLLEKIMNSIDYAL